MENKRAAGTWIILIIGAILLVMLLAGQTMAVINYDVAVSIGLQESIDKVGELLVAANKGFGMGDTVIYIPLLIAGLIGIWQRKNWGITAMMGTMGITAYWPATCMFILLYARGAEGFHFNNFCSYGILLTSITVYGIWGIWYLHKNRDTLIIKIK